MLTLAIGNNKTEPHNWSRQAGFSLVEVMVTLLIIGLMASAVILNLPEQEDRLESQAKKLALHLHMASQTSIIEQSIVGVNFDEDGYSLLRYNGDAWTPYFTYEFDENALPQISLIKNGTNLDMNKLRKSTIPAIQYDMTGLVSPFSVVFLYGTQKITLRITADGKSTLEMNGA
ncbi:MAG: prepilin-type N-terminal cleavage/methylation domain-containing protein [Robiginitomaculum sp.]|nr:prepilin-type N-terminal cleavage/methylation domain-containing protein [Robiginitomaculum sp.]